MGLLVRIIKFMDFTYMLFAEEEETVLRHREAGWACAVQPFLSSFSQEPAVRRNPHSVLCTKFYRVPPKWK